MAKSLLRSTVVVSSMTMLSRVLGLARDMTLMGVFGASGLMDAFLVAFKIPNFLRRLFAEGAFSQAFVPILSEYKQQKNLAAVQILISHVSGALALILLTLTAIVIALSPWVVAVFAPGFDPQKAALASDLLKITFPYLFFISMTAFFGGILQSYGHFAAPAFAPALLNVSMIAAALLLAPLLDTPIMALAIAVAVSGALQTLIQLPPLWRKNLLVLPSIDFGDEGLKRIFRLMLPAIFGVSVTQINLLLNTAFASLMIGGSVSWLYTAERLSELPLGLIGVAIGTVILPSLSKSQADKNAAHFTKTLDWAARLVALVGLPASVAIFALADTLIATLFVRGEFSLRDARMSGFALQGLAGGILGFMLIKIFAPAFFARQDSKTPVKIGVIAVLANMLFSGAFLGIFYWLNLPLHGALALATSGASLVNAGLLYRALNRRGIYRFGKAQWAFFGKCALACFVMLLALQAALPYFPLRGNDAAQVAALLALCVFGALVYGLCALALGIRPRHLRHG